MTLVVEENTDITGRLVGGNDVDKVVAIHVRQNEVRWGFTGGQRDQWCVERSVGLLVRDLEAVVEGVGHYDLVDPVARQVGGGDPRRRECRGKGDCVSHGTAAQSVEADRVNRVTRG